MMPIVSHIREYTTWPDGTTSNVLRMTDQYGKEYVNVFIAPSGFDINAKITAAIAAMDEQLVASEIEDLLG